MEQITPRFHFMRLFSENRPRAIAEIKGSEKYPGISGYVYFYEVSWGGMLVEAEVFGLPNGASMNMPFFYAFHIHEKGDCSLNFSKTGNHYNPANREHPHHLGDMPPLMSNNGYGWFLFFDGLLELYHILGRSVVIHQKTDDFMTQPSGNAGEKIACGIIQYPGEESSWKSL